MWDSSEESMTVPNRTPSPDEPLNAKELLQETCARFAPHKMFDFASPVATPQDVRRLTGFTGRSVDDPAG